MSKPPQAPPTVVYYLSSDYRPHLHTAKGLAARLRHRRSWMFERKDTTVWRTEIRSDGQAMGWINVTSEFFEPDGKLK